MFVGIRRQSSLAHEEEISAEVMFEEQQAWLIVNDESPTVNTRLPAGICFTITEEITVVYDSGHLSSLYCIDTHLIAIVTCPAVFIAEYYDNIVSSVMTFSLLFPSHFRQSSSFL